MQGTVTSAPADVGLNLDDKGWYYETFNL